MDPGLRARQMNWEVLKMQVVKGVCPSCHKFKMNVLLGKNTTVKCPLCKAESNAIKWVQK